MDPVLMCRLSKPLLFLAAFIWGTSFFIMKNTLDAVPVLWLLTFRFTTGDHPFQERLSHRHLLCAGPLPSLGGLPPAA